MLRFSLFLRFLFFLLFPLAFKHILLLLPIALGLYFCLRLHNLLFFFPSSLECCFCCCFLPFFFIIIEKWFSLRFGTRFVCVETEHYFFFSRKLKALPRGCAESERIGELNFIFHPDKKKAIQEEKKSFRARLKNKRISIFT